MNQSLQIVDAIQACRGREGFESLASAWSALARSFGFHFLHFPAWYAARLSVLEEPNRLIFVALYSNQQLCGVIVFEQTTIGRGAFSLPSLELAYTNEMGLCDCLLAPGVALNFPSIKKALKPINQPYFGMRFGGVSASSCIAQRLQNNSLPVKPSHVTKFLDNQKGRQHFYEGYSTKFKRNLRRKRNKALEQGSLNVKSFRNDQAVEAFKIFLELEASGWKGREATSIVQQPDKLCYYQTLVESYSSDGVLAVNLLYLGDQVIAGQIGVQIGTTLYLLKIAYDENFSAISPGYLLIDELITELDEENYLSKISFVTGVGWIDRWKPSEEPVAVYFDSGFDSINWVIKRLLKSRATTPEC